MNYKVRNDLTIIKTEEKVSSLTLLEIKDYLNKPNYNIYLENNEEIYGIITVKQLIGCNDEDLIDINYSFDYIDSNNQINAREYFKEHNGVMEYPVIIDKKLIGAFCVGTNITCLIDLFKYYDKDFVIGTETICIVKSSDNLNDKKIEFFKNFFEKKNNTVSVVSYEDFIKESTGYSICIFESNADYYNFIDISTILPIVISDTRLFSFELLLEKYNEEFNGKETYLEFLKNLLTYYKEQGVNVFNVNFTYNDYMTKLQDLIKEKYEKAGIPNNDVSIAYPEVFFDKYYSDDYFNNIMNKFYVNILEQNDEDVNHLKDQESEVFNVFDGMRNTTDHINNPVGDIHMFGPCLTVGMYVEDKNTIESFFQRRLNKDNIKMNTYNHGSFNSTIGQMVTLEETDIYKGDTIIYFNLYYDIPEIKNISLTTALEKNDIKPEWFVNSTIHVNHKINEIYANEIYDNVKDSLVEEKDRVLVSKYNNIKSKYYLKKYLSNIDINKKNGAIVMNCNPFTLGHKYLIETAAKEVDNLIIFVLSEDESLFRFNERFAMVLEGTQDIPNVRVVPTEDFIVSKKTFPEYFTKAVDDNIDDNIEKDINSFTDNIASELNIKYRFVGTEPLDEVTGKYNELLKEILPNKGIELIELDRVEHNNAPISASYVRKLLANEEYNELNNYAPNTTINCLLDKS